MWGYYVGNGEAGGVEELCGRVHQVEGRRARLDKLVQAAVYRLRGENAFTGSSGNEAPVETVLGSRLLRNGSEGSDVCALQELLLSLGYALPVTARTGIFGSETEAAVRAFQADAGLEVDGKYGEKSHDALMDAARMERKKSRPDLQAARL